jgi:spermidine/putrescine-binding protein
MIEYSILSGGNVRRNSDNAGIPIDENNREYQDYLAWCNSGNIPEPVQPVSISDMWNCIKKERDRRKSLAVKAAGHWFHSDDSSRIQQLALVMMGQNIPSNFLWKTLTFSPDPVFVSMTPVLAQQIFFNTAMSDAAIFQAAEIHRVNMENSTTPGDYDYFSGWPLSFEDELTQEQLEQFKDSS